MHPAEKDQNRGAAAPPGDDSAHTMVGDPKPWITRYVVDRLNREGRAYGYGFDAHVAQATGVTKKHVGRIRKGDSVGEKFARALERYWGMKRHQLEDEASDLWVRSDRRALEVEELFNRIVESTKNNPDLLRDLHDKLTSHVTRQLGEFGNSEFEAVSARSVPGHPQPQATTKPRTRVSRVTKKRP